MAHVVEINRIEHLEPYRPHWRELLSETPSANPFQTLEWLEAYWKHFGEGQQLRVLLEIDSGELVGVVPLTVKRENTGAGSLRFLTYVLDYWGSFYGPIGRDPQRTLTAALDYLRGTKRNWDVMELRWVGAFGTKVSTIEAAMADAGFSFCRTDPEVTSVIDLSGTWEEYLASRTTKFRNNSRRWAKRVAKRGEVRYERFRPAGELAGDGDPRWDLYEQCLDIAASSWQNESDTGTTLTHAGVAAYFRDMHEAAARTGCLDLNLLYINEEPVAFAYNYFFDGYVYGSRIGYKQEASRDGAGNVLYMKIIEDCFARGDWLYDMGPGSVEAKRYLRSELCPISRMTHFPKAAIFSVKSNLLRLARRANYVGEEHRRLELSAE